MDAFGGLRRALSGSDLLGRSLGASRIPSGHSDTMVIKKKKKKKLCFVFFSLLRLLIAHCITKPLIPSILFKSRQVDNNQSVPMSFPQMMNLIADFAGSDF